MTEGRSAAVITGYDRRTTMKKMAIVLSMVLMISMLAGCGGDKSSGGGGGGGKVPKFQTLGEAMAVDSELKQASWSPEQYVYVFEYEGTPIRVTATMTEELYDKVNSVDFFDDNKDAKIAEIVGEQPVEKIESLADGIPGEKELAELKGKKGSDLIDEGYEVWGHYYDGEKLEVTLVKGDYEYTATFEENVDGSAEDFDAESEITNLTVKEVVYNGISSNATDTINY